MVQCLLASWPHGTGFFEVSGTKSAYCKCSSSVLLSMISFNLQCCTGNECRLSVNRNSVYSSSFYGELQPPALYRKRVNYLLTTMASILLSSFKISQLTNVHSYKPQAFLPVLYISVSSILKIINSGLIIKCLDMIK